MEKCSQYGLGNDFLAMELKAYGTEESGMDRTLFQMDNQQGPTVEHSELCSVFCASLDGRGVWGRMDACIFMTESLCCLPEPITWLVGCTPK